MEKMLLLKFRQSWCKFDSLRPFCLVDSLVTYYRLCKQLSLDVTC